MGKRRLASCTDCGKETLDHRLGQCPICYARTRRHQNKDRILSRIQSLGFGESFWAKIAQSPTGCWEWQGCRNKLGYGFLSILGVRVKSHRVAWVLVNGEIPTDNSICHRCDNPPCCRPDHLFAGSGADNMRDAAGKGRNGMQRHPESLAGERHGNAKLTLERVALIRSTYAAGQANQYELAAQFGVHQCTIWAVLHGKTWGHTHLVKSPEKELVG